MHATKGFFTRVDSFVYFHIAGKNEVFSPVWLLPLFLTVVIVLGSLVTMHETKGFFTIVNSFVYFHIDGRNDCFYLVWLLPWPFHVGNGSKEIVAEWQQNTSLPIWKGQIHFPSILDGTNKLPIHFGREALQK